MSELKALAPEILLHVAKTLGVSLKALVATIELLDEGRHGSVYRALSQGGDRESG